MRLRALRLLNFRQHADTTVHFHEGLTGIIGANGSGKSTLLEAIAWTLYGMPAVRGTREGIRTLGAGARAQVRAELEFDLGGQQYRVVRELTGAELYLDGASAPIANTISGVTELIRKRLGMSLQEFFNTYFTGQKELAVMAAMGPTERGQFLSRVLGYERLRGAQALARDRRRELVAEIAGVKQGMADPDAVDAAVRAAEERWRAADAQATAARAAHDVARDTVDMLRPRWETAQRERELLQAVQAELRVAEQEEGARVRDLERLDRELAEIAHARGALERLTAEITPLDALRDQLLVLDHAAREEGRRETLVETRRVLSAELDRLGERHAQLVTAPAMEPEVRNELDQRRLELAEADRALDAARSDWVRDQQEAETKVAQLRQQLLETREQREKLVSLGEDGPCPTCTRPLGKNYRTVLDLLDEQLEAVAVNGRYYKGRIEQLASPPAAVSELDDRRREVYEAVARLDRKCARVQAAVQELRALVEDLSAKERRSAELSAEIAALPVGYDAGAHAAIRDEVARLALLDLQAQRLAAQAERAPRVMADRARAAATLVTVGSRIATLIEQRQSVEGNDHDHDRLRDEYERAMTALRVAEVAAVTADGARTTAAAARDSAVAAAADLTRARARLAALVDARRLHDELDRAFTDLRADLNQHLRPEISDIASRYLAELTDGRYTELELTESYDIRVIEENVPKPVISGGEEDIANLVLRLAISQMIADRAGQPFSLLILDEVFGSLDETRRDNVLELLRRLHDRFEQVIVITHIESVREALDQVIAVRYDEESGTARVEQEDPPTAAAMADVAGAA